MDDDDGRTRTGTDDPDRSGRTIRRLRAAGAALLVVLAVLQLPMAGAIELPPAGAPFYIQTNGPIGAVTLGDWYTATSAGSGAGHHYLAFNVPCGWPASRPIHVDLFSPEMNRVAGALNQSEEPSGNYDSTQFELYGPGVTIGPGPASPAPGTGIAGTNVTYQPGAPGVPESWVRFATLAAPVTCGHYAVRSSVLTNDLLNPGGTGDDQNGWRARIGYDDDADPTNAPPANYDDPDGIRGTNDELMLGVQQVTFQHDAGSTVCQTFYQYVGPSQASATFNNFDMDGSGRIRYYAPGDPAYDPTATTGGTAGTLSGNGVWSGGTVSTRVGDTIVNPTTGWWRLPTCVSSHNQLIQEGQTGVPVYYVQPPTPSLSLSKDDGQATVSPGETLTYTLAVQNTSSGATAGAATAVVVRDTIPGNASYQSCSVPSPASGTWTCSQSAGVVTFTQTGWIAAGDTAHLTVTVKVNQGAGGTVVNGATADYQDSLGNVFPQVSASDTDSVTPRADLSIVKTDSVDPVAPGQNFHYDLTVTNQGPADATGVHVTDSVPAGLTVSGATTGTGSCTVSGNDVDCTRAGLATGGSWAIQVDVTVDPAHPGGTVTNTATVSGDQNDPDHANDSDSETTTVSEVADLEIVKTDTADPVDPGQSYSYDLVVTNHGPADATSVQVTDSVPAGVSVTGATSPDGACVVTGNDVTCTLAVLAASDTWTISVDVTADATHPGGTVTNTASVTADQTDPDVANNSSPQDTTVNPWADLEMQKTDSVDPVDPGQAFHYDLVVTNHGPASATNVHVVDTVPAALTVTGTVAGAGSCTVTGSLVDCLRPSIASGGTWTVEVDVTVDPAHPGGTVSNTASVSGSEHDPDPANDADTEPTTIRALADLQISKTDSADPVAPGGSFTYDIVVTNQGPAPATNVTVSDTIPAGLAVNGTSAGAGSCSVSGNDVTCSRAALASGGTWTIHVDVTVDPANPGGTVTNTAVVIADQVDPDTSNNADSEDTTVGETADLRIRKSDSRDPVVAGDPFVYDLVVRNLGPADATNVSVSDPVPAGLTVAGVRTASGACSFVGNDVSCAISVLSSGASWTIHVDVATSSTDPGTTYANTAHVDADQSDPDATNDDASEDTTVAGVADLEVTKAVDDATAAEGDRLTYTIMVTNHGPARATGVVVTDTYPDGLSFVSADPETGTYDGATGRWAVGAVDVDATWSLELVMQIDPVVDGSTIVNRASVSGDQVDPAGGNDDDGVPVTVSKASGGNDPGGDGGQDIQGTGGSTASTGSDLAGMVLLDVLLLLAGAVAMAISRLRRGSHAG